MQTTSPCFVVQVAFRIDAKTTCQTTCQVDADSPGHARDRAIAKVMADHHGASAFTFGRVERTRVLVRLTPCDACGAHACETDEIICPPCKAHNARAVAARNRLHRA